MQVAKPFFGVGLVFSLIISGSAKQRRVSC